MPQLRSSRCSTTHAPAWNHSFRPGAQQGTSSGPKRVACASGPRQQKHTLHCLGSASPAMLLTGHLMLPSHGGTSYLLAPDGVLLSDRGCSLAAGIRHLSLVPQSAVRIRRASSCSTRHIIDGYIRKILCLCGFNALHDGCRLWTVAAS